MVAPNYSKLCEQAEQYYYDFLCGQDEQPIPIEVINHIVNCNNCREQINQLEGMLAESKEPSMPGLSHRQTAVTAILKLHFSYTGQNVTCKTVRPFLPSLLDPALQIRIPTPITAHIDNCEQCKDDLETLRELNLSPKQLKILSQLFSDDLEGDETTCEKARESFAAVVAMAFDHTDAKTLRHLSLCPNCREELYKFREEIVRQATLKQSEENTGAKRVYCPSVTAGDVFDYCIPYNIDPASDEYAKFRKSLTTHIVCCADCLDKIQQLHRVIYGIIHKPESGVATVLHFDTSVKVEQQDELDNSYVDFPVKVEVADLGAVQADRERPYEEEFREPVKLKSFSKNFRPFLKVALPVAAMVVVAFGLWFNVSSAKALTINQIQEAILKVTNVHIASFVPDVTEPTQEEWVSRQPDTYIMKSGDKLVFWNVNQGIRKATDSKLNKTEQSALSSEETSKIGAMINGTLGLIPFEDISVLPKDAKWIRLADMSMSRDTTVLEVYDLLWVERASLASNKWRVYVNPGTKLPRRSEFYQKLSSEEAYVLKSFNVIDYPTDDEMHVIDEKMSF